MNRRHVDATPQRLAGGLVGALVSLVVALPVAAAAAVPMELTYRGTLDDTDGPFTGTVGMIFDLCDAPAAGACPWSEGHSVNVQDGRFAVSLGGSSPIPDTLLRVTPELYLAITIDGTPMVGRQKLQATAFTRGAGWAGHALDGAPVGTVVAWHKNLDATVPTLPGSWVECDGQQITDADSPYYLLNVPDLNGSARFLRGGTTSGVVQSDQLQSHTHTDTGHNHDFNRPKWFSNEPSTGVHMYYSQDGAADSNTSSTIAGYANLDNPTESTAGTPRHGAETRPLNMSVVWIIKIK